MISNVLIWGKITIWIYVKSVLTQEMLNLDIMFSQLLSFWKSQQIQNKPWLLCSFMFCKQPTFMPSSNHYYVLNFVNTFQAQIHFLCRFNNHGPFNGFKFNCEWYCLLGYTSITMKVLNIALILKNLRKQNYELVR